jgi:hypothetical protein
LQGAFLRVAKRRADVLPPLRHLFDIIVRPTATWRRISVDRLSVAGLFFAYVVPLVLLGPIATFVAQRFVGVRAGHVLYHASTSRALVQAGFALGFALAGIVLVTLLVDAVVPAFGGRRSFPKAFRVAAFASTPVWLAATLVLVPHLAFVQLLAVADEIYLLYAGLWIVMGVPRRKAIPLAGFAVAGTVAIGFGVGALLARIAQS